jgi:hypothetical protein
LFTFELNIAYNLWWMEPKFQSSFIPKGPISDVRAPRVGMMKSSQRAAEPKSLIFFISATLFAISFLFLVGVFGYKYYLNYKIGQMSAELAGDRSALLTDSVSQLIQLNKRIVSTNSLIDAHQVISPLFDFLSEQTPKSVRYTDFDFENTRKGLELSLKGDAQSYTAVAQAAQLFSNSQYFQSASFSDLTLNESGNVVFSLTAMVSPGFLSYEKLVEAVSKGGVINSSPNVVQPAATSTATTTKAVATSTKATATSTKK